MTSQAPLNFVGEHVMRMPPLALPDGSRTAEGAIDPELESVPAVALLLTRIQAVQPGFALTSTNATAVIEICTRLDGTPLALELAASRFALLSPDQVLERLDHRFRFLVSDVTGRDPRHQNLVLLLE